MLEIITYNPTLERVGASNRYISHGQSSSYKASFEIELGPLDFNNWKRSNAKAQSHKLPPGPWKLPLLGNLHQLVVFTLPHRYLTDLAKKYGPIMQLQLGEVLAIVISSPKLAKELMKTHDAAFANRPNVLAVEVMSYDNSSLIFSRYNDYWRKMRKILVTEFLSAKRIQSFKTIREEEVWNFIESISSSEAEELNPINLSEKISSLTYGITARAAIGKKCKYEKELISLIKEMFILSGGFDVPDLFPSLKFLSFLTGTKPALEKIRQDSRRYNQRS